MKPAFAALIPIAKPIELAERQTMLLERFNSVFQTNYHDFRANVLLGSRFWTRSWV
jgi:hypothetical protein